MFYRRGYAPTITVFMNQYMFYGISDPNAGYPDYDHIVSATSIDSNFDDDVYHDDDIITLDDHGLYGPWPEALRPYYFSYSFVDFMGDRHDANSKTTGFVYTLPAVTEYGNYGITHTGPTDVDKVLLPVRVDTDVNYEKPEIKNRSEERPDAMELTLSITVSGLQSGVAYTLYRYRDETDVPTVDFNANSEKAVEKVVFVASGMCLNEKRKKT